MSSRRQELLNAAVEYLLEHGVANASLRPMAKALGTSARMLMFHFQSKEGLLQAAMEELHVRLRDSFVAQTEHNTADRGPLIKRYWLWATKGKNGAFLRLLYEIQVIAAQNPKEYGRYLKKSSVGVQSMVLDAISAAGGSLSMATLCIAVFDGLFLEFMQTGDRKRLGEALDLFISLATPATNRD
jgi:AcrR family transcriptional regulator